MKQLHNNSAVLWPMNNNILVNNRHTLGILMATGNKDIITTGLKEVGRSFTALRASFLKHYKSMSFSYSMQCS
jgi:hypothetical protein